MSMKAKLAEVRAWRRPISTVPEQSETLLAAQAIRPVKVDVIEPKPPPDRDAIAARLHAAFGSGREPDRKDIKHAAWCLWEGKAPLAADQRILDAYLAFIQKSGQRPLFRRLASTYLIAFPQRNPTLATIAQRLKAMATRARAPWDHASRVLHLFDPRGGPITVAEIALGHGSTPSRILEEHGIGGLAAESGFGEAAFLHGLALLQAQRPGNARVHLDQVKAWVLRPDNSLIFDQHRRQLVDAAVLPWANAASKEVRDRILSFLLARFGDPRLRPGEWTQMAGSPAERIVRRWLTDQSLRQFLDVVDASATREDQWVYRRAFWEAVYRGDLITDAWVIFDPTGIANAQKVFGTETPFGCWRKGSQIAQGQACLLLRIGGGVVAEWSQNGMCHIWHDANHPTAPRLYQSEYRKSEVRHDKLKLDPTVGQSIPHSSPAPNYIWQPKVTKAIRSMTNIHIERREYTVSE